MATKTKAAAQVEVSQGCYTYKVVGMETYIIGGEIFKSPIFVFWALFGAILRSI